MAVDRRVRAERTGAFRRRIKLLAALITAALSVPVAPAVASAVSAAGRVPLGAYGMTEAVAAVLEHRPGASFGDEIATGGTLFANALSLAAARATLGEVLTDESYDHAANLGHKLADGIEEVAGAHGLEWRAHRLYNRSGYTHACELPTDAIEARASFDIELYDLQRLYMANRGIWEAINSAGPACGIQTAEPDVDRYLELLDNFVRALKS